MNPRRRDLLKLGAGAAALSLLPGAAEPASSGWDEVPRILARIKPPVFPDRVFDVSKYGAVGDGRSDATEAIAMAKTARTRENRARDANPQAPVHILLVPKEHVESIAELEERHGDALAELFVAAAHLAKAEGVDRTGWRIVSNVGPDAGQSVAHLHFHLLGGRQMAWPPG